jgi:hypothetical protein
MIELNSNEILIEGKWTFDGASMHMDESCQRIEWLISNKLKKLVINGGGWESLYQDPKDQRYWLLTYPESHMHGCGPPLIKVITKSDAQDKLNSIS